VNAPDLIIPDTKASKCFGSGFDGSTGVNFGLLHYAPSF
jgi:hypothetical protein